MRSHIVRLISIVVALLVAVALLAACSDDADDPAPSAGDVVAQFREAVNAEDVAAIEALLDPDVVQREFLYTTDAPEPFSPDLVGREAVMVVYDPGDQSGDHPMPPQGTAVVEDPDAESIEERTVTQSEDIIDDNGDAVYRVTVMTEVSEDGLIEQLTIVYDPQAAAASE